MSNSKEEERKENSFPCKTWSSRDTVEEVEESLNKYHFWKEYNKDKDWHLYKDDLGPFETDFGNGKHKYQYELYTFTVGVFDRKLWEKEKKDPRPEKSYVIAKELFEKDEIIKLLDYCPCSGCKYYRKHPIIFIFLRIFCNAYCPCCYGCLSSGPGYIQQWVMDEARSIYEKRND